MQTTGDAQSVNLMEKGVVMTDGDAVASSLSQEIRGQRTSDTTTLGGPQSKMGKEGVESYGN